MHGVTIVTVPPPYGHTLVATNQLVVPLFITGGVMNIEQDYSYYQPWSDNEWLVDEMIAMREEILMVQNKDITMQ